MQLNNFYRTVSLLAIAVMMNFSSATAQSAIDQAHVEPRTQRSRADSMNSVAKTENAIIRKTVNLVLVPVIVIDLGHRIFYGTPARKFPAIRGQAPTADQTLLEGGCASLRRCLAQCKQQHADKD
jgi:hypothetical protein